MDGESTTGAPAGLMRRLAALMYDALLVFAVAFVATFAVLPFTGGEAILTDTWGMLGPAYHALVVLLVFAYFAGSWMRSGQTLGMKAWRIRVETHAGTRLGWAGALVRFALGAALCWLALTGGWFLSQPGSALVHAGSGALMLPAAGNFAWMFADRSARTL